MWLSSLPCAPGKGRPPRRGAEASRAQRPAWPRFRSPERDNTHHLDNLCPPLILQAAFQVLGPALFLLLEHRGDGDLRLGAGAALVS